MPSGGLAGLRIPAALADWISINGGPSGDLSSSIEHMLRDAETSHHIKHWHTHTPCACVRAFLCGIFGVLSCVYRDLCFFALVWWLFVGFVSFEIWI